jgi:HlyD family secretion protein
LIAKNSTNELLRHRQGGMLIWLMLALLVAGAVAAYYFYSGTQQPETVKISAEDVIPIAPKLFQHSLNEPGDVESSNNTEIRCEIQSRNSSGTMILEIIPNGTTVKPGDFLVRFDSSALENERNQQLIMCNNSQAAMAQSKATYETAIITKQEYLEGTFKQEEQAIQSEVFVAEENLRRAQEYARYSERLAARGYVTGVQVEADKFAVEKARKELDTAETKLKVLREFTKAKMLKTLEANIESAEAKMKADENTNKLDQAKLALIQAQIDKCRVVSQVSGKVNYANVMGSRGGSGEIIIQDGALIRERQPVIRIPDLTKMQVMAKINETRIGYVRPGMKATVRFESFQDLALTGKVMRMDDQPIPTSMFGTQIKQYATYVEIDNPPEGLIRPGMTAKVQIHVDEVADALVVPIESVFQHKGEYYCLVQNGDNLEPTWVSVGAQSGQEVVIKDGLKAGDKVVKKPDPLLMNKALALEFPKAPAGKSAKEVAASMLKRPTPVASKANDPASMVKKLLEKYDTNNDGQIEVSDLPDDQKDRLAKADLNHDGHIERAELLRSMANRRPNGTEPGKGARDEGAGQ